jgi:hypothetical protein
VKRWGDQPVAALSAFASDSNAAPGEDFIFARLPNVLQLWKKPGRSGD